MAAEVSTCICGMSTEPTKESCAAVRAAEKSSQPKEKKAKIEETEAGILKVKPLNKGKGKGKKIEETEAGILKVKPLDNGKGKKAVSSEPRGWD